MVAGEGLAPLPLQLALSLPQPMPALMYDHGHGRVSLPRPDRGRARVPFDGRLGRQRPSPLPKAQRLSLTSKVRSSALPRPHRRQ